MNLVHKIETWGNTHHPIALDPMRIALGLFLLFKGASFMQNSYPVHAIIANQNIISLSDSILMNMVYVVAIIHMIGGMMIALGVVTRIASLIQIPILAGAVIFLQSMNVHDNTNMVISIVALVLLVMFSVVGSGKLSIEKVMQNSKLIF